MPTVRLRTFPANKDAAPVEHTPAYPPLSPESIRASVEILSTAPRRAIFLAGPEWRNWQTQQTQNLPELCSVWVRLPPPGPIFADWQPFRVRRIFLPNGPLTD